MDTADDIGVVITHAHHAHMWVFSLIRQVVDEIRLLYLSPSGRILQETDNPDLRDRAYVYWRLLSSDPEAARSVVLAEKPVIAQDTSAMDPKLLQTLLGNLSTLSSVYHLPPSVSLRTAQVYACCYL